MIERLASSVEREIEPAPPPVEHWGKALNALLDSLDMSDWEALEMDDPVEWVKQQWIDDLKQQFSDWDKSE